MFNSTKNTIKEKNKRKNKRKNILNNLDIIDSSTYNEDEMHNKEMAEIKLMIQKAINAIQYFSQYTSNINDLIELGNILYLRYFTHYYRKCESRPTPFDSNNGNAIKHLKINQAAQLASISTVYFLKNNMCYHDDTNNDDNNVDEIIINLTVDILMKEVMIGDDDDSEYSSCSSMNSDDEISIVLNKYCAADEAYDDEIQSKRCTPYNSKYCNCNDTVIDDTYKGDDNILWSCLTCTNDNDYVEIVHNDDDDITYYSGDNSDDNVTTDNTTNKSKRGNNLFGSIRRFFDL